MISKKIEKAVNDQINFEFYSAYLYFSMANYYSSSTLLGFAKWMTEQAKEEISHAAKLCEYIHDRGGSVALEKIDKPTAEWEGPGQAMEAAHGHECVVSKNLSAIYKLCMDEGDFMSATFIQGFISEQIEEEATSKTIADKLKLIGKGGGLFYLDKEMGKRGQS